MRNLISWYWWQNFFHVLKLLYEVPPILLRPQQLDLGDATGDVGVEVEILLDGGHQDQLTDESVLRSRRAEIGFKHLEEDFVLQKCHLHNFAIFTLPGLH